MALNLSEYNLPRASDIDTKMLERALEFYYMQPTGQYDDVAAAVILQVLKNRYDLKGK